MNKKLFIYVLLIFFSVSLCEAEDSFYVQSLNIGDDIESSSSITYSTKELPNFNKTSEDTAQANQSSSSNNIYYNPYYNPYYYNPYYSTYRIGPYYGRGIGVGGYNYTGFAYNYSSGNKVITTPVQKVTIPNAQPNIPPTQNIKPALTPSVLHQNTK